LREPKGIIVDFLETGGTALVFTISGENLMKLSECCLFGISADGGGGAEGGESERSGIDIMHSLDLTVQQIHSKNFVVKIYKKTKVTQSFQKTFTETCARLNTYRGYISSIPSQESRKSFLLPVSCGSIRITDKFSSYFEIQEYGGKELVDVFNKVLLKTLALSKPKINNALTSLIGCLEGIVHIISTYQIMILDIKPENMVMNVEDGEVKMIDIDWVSIKDLKTSFKGRSSTPGMNTMPGQMLAKVLHDIFIGDPRKQQKAYIIVDRLYNNQLGKEYTLFSPSQIIAEKKKTKQVLGSIPSLLQQNDEMCVQLAYFHTGWAMLHIMLSVLKYVLQDQRITSQFYDDIVVPFHQLRLEKATKRNMDTLISNLKEFISQNFQYQHLQSRDEDRQQVEYQVKTSDPRRRTGSNPDKRKKSSSNLQEPQPKKQKQQQSNKKPQPTICSIM
jgi:hypothetical protein